MVHPRCSPVSAGGASTPFRRDGAALMASVGGWKAPHGAVYGDQSPGATPGATSEWRNWQTRQLEGLVSARTWGFKSPLRHQRSARTSQLSPIELRGARV
jgi:hypothetical protein